VVYPDETPARRVPVKLLVVTGGCAVLAAVGVAVGANSWTSGGGRVALAGPHSEDGATGTTYVQLTVPAASVNPTAMTIGSTVTASTAAPTMATPVGTVVASLTTQPACVSHYCPWAGVADP
jgi:hypothetical protein